MVRNLEMLERRKQLKYMISLAFFYYFFEVVLFTRDVFTIFKKDFSMNIEKVDKELVNAKSF
jgi:hypothetical protein